MPELQVNLINPNFFFYSHDTSFVPTSSTASSATQTPDSDSAGDIEILASLGVTIRQLESGYCALKPIPLTIEYQRDGYIASFEAANIHTSGETLFQAAQNLKSLILDIFDSLTAEPFEKLGPGPKRQLAMLLRYVEKNHP